MWTCLLPRMPGRIFHGSYPRGGSVGCRMSRSGMLEGGKYGEAESCGGGGGRCVGDSFRAPDCDCVEDRYRILVRKQRIEADPSYIFCPRLICQTPIKRENLDEKLGICGRCGFTFCILCNRTW